MKEFIKILTDCGWNFTPCKEVRPITNERLAQAPAEFKEFTAQFDVLANGDDTAWFLSLKDYETEAEEDAFAWNEFEKDSLEFAEDDNERKEITKFWNSMLPIALSVDGQYSYLAIVLDGEERGKIVFGCEPVYEEPEVICESFTELLTLFAAQASGNGDEDSLLNGFIQ